MHRCFCLWEGAEDRPKSERGVGLDLVWMVRYRRECQDCSTGPSGK